MKGLTKALLDAAHIDGVPLPAGTDVGATGGGRDMAMTMAKAKGAHFLILPQFPRPFTFSVGGVADLERIDAFSMGGDSSNGTVRQQLGRYRSPQGYG